MFPTLSDLFAYLFHIHVRLPIQTFGFFVALSFLLTYLAFVSEFKRKEAQGLIHAFKRKVVVGTQPSIPELLLNALLGFVFGYKILGALFSYGTFISYPKIFILSAQGSLVAGLLCGGGWAGWAWYDRKKAQLPQPVEVEQTVHPYQLMARITFWCGVIGF